MTTIGKYITETTKRLQKTVYCDFCKTNIKDLQFYNYDKEDEANCFVRTGYVSSESDGRFEKSIDVCSKCFLDRIIPAIEKLGVKFRGHYVDDHDYVDEMKE